jgi:hypothetical protein
MKKTKERPHLDAYKLFIEHDCIMPDFGLCEVLDKIRYGYRLPSARYFRMFNLHRRIRPTDVDFEQLIRENKSRVFWGSDSNSNRPCLFTPLRQNLLLLLAAMNNEL